MVEIEPNMMRGQFKEFCHAISTLSDKVPSESVKDPPQESFGTIHHQPELVRVNSLELFENLLSQGLTLTSFEVTLDRPYHFLIFLERLKILFLINFELFAHQLLKLGPFQQARK